MSRTLPARPSLDHLRRQAKTLLTRVHDGDAAAARAFIDHLPGATGLTVGAVRAAAFRLADSQSVVARQNGFASWPALLRHVQALRGLEGEWQIASLDIDGAAMPAAVAAQTRLLFDGDRFRTESPEATYEGRFTIDVESAPARIDIDFVAGPEAGNTCQGIFERDGDRMTLCLGLTGASRPEAFAAPRGSGHALERLHRISAARPANVSGGTPPPIVPAAPVAPEDPSGFELVDTPLMRRMAGEWLPVQLVRDGKPMPEQWLSFGSRTTVGNEVKVVFGGQVMVHARMRVDESATPMAIDYLHLNGHHVGAVSRGIIEWAGDEVRILMPAPGQARPRDFGVQLATGTLSQWRKR